MRRLRLLTAPLAALVIALLLGGLTGFLAPAFAHGELVDGSPGPGDALAPGGELVALEFNELAENGRALIAITDSTDEPVAVGAAQTTADAGAICAATAPLEVGVYRLEYSATSNDGDLIRGSYTYEVVADGDAPANQITEACSDLELQAPGDAETLDEMGTGKFPTFLPYLLGVLLVIALGLVVRRVRADRREGEPRSTGGQPNPEDRPDAQL